MQRIEIDGVPVSPPREPPGVGRNMCGILVHEEMYGRKAVEAVGARIPSALWLVPTQRSRETSDIPVG